MQLLAQAEELFSRGVLDMKREENLCVGVRSELGPQFVVGARWGCCWSGVHKSLLVVVTVSLLVIRGKLGDVA